MFLEAFRRTNEPADSEFPWTVPALRKIRFTAPVTFLICETGCGKSTLLEALAISVEAEAAGTVEISEDDTMAHSPILAAFPGASIKVFDGEKIDETAFSDLEHVRITRDFLKRYLRYLTRKDDE